MVIFRIQCKMYFKWAFFCLCPKPKLSSCTYFPDLLVRVLESPLTCCIQLVYTHGEKGRENTVRVTVMVREGEFPVKKKKKRKEKKKKENLVSQLQCSQACWGYCQSRNCYVCLACDGCVPEWLLHVSANWRLPTEALPLWFWGWC